jgi:transcriptional regulator with XRE-family HTH domain
MASTTIDAMAPAGGPGPLLRHWRRVRGRSQFDLSLDAGISQRQISFIESGRSAPSRHTVIDLAQALDVPLRERNVLLLAAGYAPIYSEGAWDAEEMRGVTRALDRVLRQHEPFPAVVMDRHWNVLMTNQAAPRFFGRFFDLEARPSPRNLLHLVFDPAGLRPFIANWEEAAAGLIGRLHREAVGRVLDRQTSELLSELLAYPDVETTWQTPNSATSLPMIPLSFALDGRTLDFFSMVTTVGTPQSVAAQELRIECLFPADDESETLYVGLG